MKDAKSKALSRKKLEEKTSNKCSECGEPMRNGTEKICKDCK